MQAKSKRPARSGNRLLISVDNSKRRKLRLEKLQRSRRERKDLKRLMIRFHRRKRIKLRRIADWQRNLKRLNFKDSI